MSASRYLKRMDASMEDKMKVVQFIPKEAEYVLDVGCASGHVTRHMANQLPDVYFQGIDVSLPFIGMANAENNLDNTGFSHNWLSDLHDYDTKYDAITFMSVLHEFYSYGQGVTSVIKALCDAHELLKPEGVIIIRDMLRPDDKPDDMSTRMALDGKIEHASGLGMFRTDYQSRRSMSYLSWSSLNDLLLHLLYTDNWENEIQENYMFWTAEDYIRFGKHVLGMEVIAYDCYLLDYVARRWRKELWLNEMELSTLYSTGIVGLRK